MTIVRLLCHVGFQLEAAKRLVMLREKKNWVAKAAKELAGRQLKAEVPQISDAQSRSS